MQLVLPVSFRKQDAFETFIERGNEQVVRHLQDLAGLRQMFPNASQRISLLYSKQPRGNTHLLLATCEHAAKLGFTHQYLNLHSLQEMPPQMLSSMIEASKTDVICIDNLHAIDAKKSWQIALFDIINQFVERDNTLLVISTSIPIDTMNFELPDLKTRLTWGTNFNLVELDDEDKLSAIELQLNALGIDASQDVINFLFSRTSRDMQKLSECIDNLDKASLASKRKVTIPFIKSVLAL